jgi:hypothetical protein
MQLSRQISRPGRFFTRGRTRYQLEAGWAPQPVWAVLEKKILLLQVFEPRTIQPVAS